MMTIMINAFHGETPAPATIWQFWERDPVILLGLVLAALLYGRGLYVIWRRAGIGRGVHARQVVLFLGGLLVLFVALVSPLAALGHVLFSAHMIQHLLLIIAAPPLLVLSRPGITFAWALPQGLRLAGGRLWRRAHRLAPLARQGTHPLVVWVLQAAVLWVWHAPVAYEATLNSEPVHILEHTLFLGTAILFWWTLINAGGRGHLGYGAAVLYIFANGMQSTVLGALMTFSSRPWYPTHADQTTSWGLSPLEDQQLAGALMWIPPGIILLIAAAMFFLAWLAAVEHTMQMRT